MWPTTSTAWRWTRSRRRRSSSCGAPRCSTSLSAPLCNALLETTDAHTKLRALEAANLFLVPLDRRREWYRYHALFREFLLAELHRDEPDVTMKLHLRAADWYEANGSPALALEHLLDTTEQDRCAALMAMLIIPTYGAGQISTVQRWLATIGDAGVESHPPLAVFAAWISALAGDTMQAQRWAAAVDAASLSRWHPTARRRSNRYKR